jgi:hypothetical protein
MKTLATLTITVLFLGVIPAAAQFNTKAVVISETGQTVREGIQLGGVIHTNRTSERINDRNATAAERINDRSAQAQENTAAIWADTARAQSRDAVDMTAINANASIRIAEIHARTQEVVANAQRNNYRKPSGMTPSGYAYRRPHH